MEAEVLTHPVIEQQEGPSRSGCQYRAAEKAMIPHLSNTSKSRPMPWGYRRGWSWGEGMKSLSTRIPKSPGVATGVRADAYPRDSGLEWSAERKRHPLWGR